LDTDYSKNLGDVLDETMKNYDVKFDDGIITKDRQLSYIHKAQNHQDIYFLANSNENKISSYINIRSKLNKPIIWDPHTGTKYIPEFTSVGEGDDQVTRIKLDMNPVNSIFILEEPIDLKCKSDWS